MDDAILTWPEDGFRRVPYGVFHDPAIYAREQERIFRGPCWHFLALEAELPGPGDFKSTFIGDTPVVVTRERDGRLAGFVNRCAHRGNLLCLEESGQGRDGFTCVYHAWSYDLAGNLKSAAFRKGIRGEGGLPTDFRLEEHGLEKLRVDSIAGAIFGTLDARAEPLLDYIGDTVAFAFRRIMHKKIRILGYDTQIIQANWKTYCENGRDTYHANILHAFFATFGVSRQSQESGIKIDPRGLHYFTYTKRGTEVESADYNETTAGLRSVVSDFSLADPSLLAWQDEFGDGSSTHLTTLFPMFMIQQVSHSLAVRQIVPKSPERFELVFTYFGYEDDPPALAEQRLKHVNLTGSAGLVSMEDGSVCEFVGKGTTGSPGASSFIEMGGKGLTDGGMSKLSERPIRNFWNCYRGFMGL
jgi:phenylpropionate dioxygenase-like ring-hydroxylating dioxygenase large terminal subunit